MLMFFLLIEGPSAMSAVSRSKMVADFLPVIDLRYSDYETQRVRLPKFDRTGMAQHPLSAEE